jgi:leucyl aminopeptidase
MKVIIESATSGHPKADLFVTFAFQKKAEKTTTVDFKATKEIQQVATQLKSWSKFKAGKGESLIGTLTDGTALLVLGLGDKTAYTKETMRRDVIAAIKGAYATCPTIALDFDHLKGRGSEEEWAQALSEALLMSDYSFDKYLSSAKEKNPNRIHTAILSTHTKGAALKKVQSVIDDTAKVVESINFARDLVNEAPNVLHSEEYSKQILADVKKLPGVKAKVLGKAELKKEKANLFLSVNAASAHAPQLVHLTYTPKGATTKTKHVALVGKGLTFDTGGYSLKGGEFMMNMKFDMAGSATVYAAFRAAALLGLKVKLTCILGITDNAVGPTGTTPDSVVIGRNGKSVEILNTDAEGRLVLADCLDYACDLKPDAIIDAATLTGACLVAVGSEVCAIMGNDQKLVDSLLKSAKNTDEYMWQLPIIPEFAKDMKGTVSDLKNIAGNRYGGTSKAAAFLNEFIKDDIAWAHLDIAGIADGQPHLPYCPNKGASGLVVRTLVDYIANC